MSKSLGNFFTLEEFCEKYSADATRLSLAMAGDSIENANLDTNEADNAILKLTNLEKIIINLMKSLNTFREKSSP